MKKDEPENKGDAKKPKELQPKPNYISDPSQGGGGPVPPIEPAPNPGQGRPPGTR